MRFQAGLILSAFLIQSLGFADGQESTNSGQMASNAEFRAKPGASAPSFAVKSDAFAGMKPIALTNRKEILNTSTLGTSFVMNSKSELDQLQGIAGKLGLKLRDIQNSEGYQQAADPVIISYINSLRELTTMIMHNKSSPIGPKLKENLELGNEILKSAENPAALNQTIFGVGFAFAFFLAQYLPSEGVATQNVSASDMERQLAAEPAPTKSKGANARRKR